MSTNDSLMSSLLFIFLLHEWWSIVQLNSFISSETRKVLNCSGPRGVDFSANWHSNTCFDVRLIINYKSQCRTSQLFVYKINMPNEECILSSIPYLIIICTVWDSWLISLLINQSHGLLIMYLSWACQLSHCLSLIQKKTVT